MDGCLVKLSSYIPRIYSSNGKNLNEWQKLLFQINLNEEIYKDIALDLKQSLIDKYKVELTFDLIDLIIDYGEDEIIKYIANEEFLSLFIDLLRKKHKMPINIQKEILFLIQKWTSKFVIKNEYPIFKEKYEFLKSNQIIFPNNNYFIHTYNKYISNDDIFNTMIKINNLKLKNKELKELLNQFMENTKTKICIRNENAPETPYQNIDNNIGKCSLINKPNNNIINNYNVNFNILNIDNNTIVRSNYWEEHEKIFKSFKENKIENIEDKNIINISNDKNNLNIKENYEKNINVNFNINNIKKKESLKYTNKSEKIFNINSYKLEVGNKILNINKIIDNGKGNFFNKELHKEVITIIKEIPKCRDLMNKFNNSIDINENLIKLRMDIKQTCFRYHCFLCDYELYPFVSSFSGNKNQYDFNEEAIINYNMNNFSQ